jgi:hypothetical protein
MATQWGGDSVIALSTSNYRGSGRKFADYVINSYFASSPRDTINFWGRYFAHNASGYLYQNDSEAQALNDAVRSYDAKGSGFIFPIDAGPQADISGNWASGIARATACTNYIKSKLGNKLTVQANSLVYVYLDIEGSTTLSTDFWNGWAVGVDYATYNSNWTFSAGAYLGTAAAFANSGPILQNAGEACSAIVSGQPARVCSSGGCGSPGPSWAPSNLAGITTQIWQYSIAGRNVAPITMCYACRANFPDCDLNATNPSVGGPLRGDGRDYMLQCWS